MTVIVSFTSDLDIKLPAFIPSAIKYAHFPIVRFKTPKSNIEWMVLWNDIRGFVIFISCHKYISAQHARRPVITTPPSTAHSEELVTNIIMLDTDNRIDYVTE